MVHWRPVRSPGARGCGLAAGAAGVYRACVKGAAPPTGLYGFRLGVLASLPLNAAVVPFALLYGTIAVSAGLTPLDAILMSAVVYAGASQLVAIDLFTQGIPAWSILLAVLAVNFRHLLYSAALTPVFRPLRPLTKVFVFPFLVDPVYADTERRLAEGRGFSPSVYFGMSVGMYVSWVGGSILGATFGQLVNDPERLAFDMVMPLFFLALAMAFRGRPNWGVTVLVSSVLSVAVYYAPEAGLTMLGPPWHIMAGAVGGVAAAVIVVERDGADGERPVDETETSG